MKRIKSPNGLSGVDGLVASVISQAVKDAMRGETADKVDALRYLRSAEYQKHLQILDLPSTWLPADKE
jgi:hypothetical protein